MRRLRLPRFEVGSLGSGPKIPICGYQFLETECPIQSTRIGQDPDVSTTKPHELLSPFDASLSRNSCKGRFTQKRQIPRVYATSKLSFEFPGSFVKFMTRKLSLALTARSLHCSRQTGIRIEESNCRLQESNQMWSKPCQRERTRQNRVSRAREMGAPARAALSPGLIPTKHHVKVLPSKSESRSVGLRVLIGFMWL